LQQKYKNDRQKLNEEMMKFYKENQINPLAGCLPLLLQMPLFIVLYQVIHGLTHQSHGHPAPKYINHDSDLYRALVHAGGKMISWGIDLAQSASKVHGSKVIPYYILVALVVLTGWYQQRQMTARNPQAAQNPQAQMMGKVFPIVFGFISLNIAAGVVVYFIVSNLWQIGQQAIVFRGQGPGDTPGKMAKPQAPPKTGGDGNGARQPRPQSRPPARRGGNSRRRGRK